MKELRPSSSSTSAHQITDMAIHRWFCLLVLFVLLIPLPTHAAEPKVTQLIELHPGWNLISLQVGNGLTPARFTESLGFDAAKLRAIWGFSEPTVSGSAPWQWKLYRADPGLPNDLTLLQPGKGYWVEVTEFCTAEISGIPWDGSISVRQGWNLLGFPGLSRENTEVQELASVFGSHFARVTQVWEWDSGSAQRFKGYDISSIPQVKELPGVQPGRAYWVFALNDFTLSPRPTLALPGDADAAPLEPEVGFSVADFPLLPNPQDYIYTDAQGVARGIPIRKVRGASEDVPFDLNGNKIIDSAFTQNTLLFEIGVDRKVISITNTGTGLCNWSIENTVPWLFTEPPDEKNHPGNSGRSKTAAGTVSTETDSLTLYVDTRGLLPGRLTGQILVHLAEATRVVTVLLDVPVTAGDWKGYATTQRVNGRSVSIGAVDLGLNLFMLSDNLDETGFRAVLNQETSLLFPRDVFMNGVFFTSRQFSMTTSFEMPEGDRNAPPFDTFQEPANYDTLSAADRVRADFDANGDGIAEVSNPFPYPVRREITLLGERVTPDRLEGSYIESITGMLPKNEAIFVEGTFFLDRQSFSPTKRSIFNEVTDNAPVVIGGTTGVLYRELTLDVTNAVTISGIVLGLNVTFPDPSRLTITLFGPNGQSVVIHQGGTTLPSSLELAQFNNLIGAGTWRMRVAWTPTAERGYFNNWSLNMQGLATYAATGKVVGNLGAGNVPLPDVQLTLSGSNVIKQTTTSADGAFSITGLTEDNYNMTLSRPGFQTRIVPFFISDSDLYLAESGPVEAAGAPDAPMILAPVTVSTPQLVAGPFIGQEPLHVTFNALIPLSQLTALGTITTATWNFGDGITIADTASATDAVHQTTARHTYIAAGHYRASLVLSGSLGSLNVPAIAIDVQRATPDASLVNGQPQTHQVLVAGFAGAIAAPLANGIGNLQSAPGSGATTQQIWVKQSNGTYANTTVGSVRAGIIYQESQRDSGGFDIDRFPLIPTPASPQPSDFHLTAEDSDFASRLYVSGDGTPTLPFLARPFNPTLDPASDNTPGSFLLYEPPQVNGRPIPDRFRCFVTLGGAVFNVEPSVVGDFVLQPGRIEP